jgi:hypothetical protein
LGETKVCSMAKISILDSGIVVVIVGKEFKRLGNK